MELPAGYSMALPSYYFALCATALICSRYGGRYERSMVALQMGSAVGALLSQCITHHYTPFWAFTLIDTAVFIGFVRIIRRYVRWWGFTSCLVRAVVVALDVYFECAPRSVAGDYAPIADALDYVVMLSICYGALRRRFGPPQLIPPLESARLAHTLAPLPYRLHSSKRGDISTLS